MTIASPMLSPAAAPNSNLGTTELSTFHRLLLQNLELMATPVTISKNMHPPANSIPVALSIRCINCARRKINYTHHNSCFPTSVSQTMHSLLKLRDNHFAFNHSSGGGRCEYIDQKTNMKLMVAYPTYDYGKSKLDEDFVSRFLGNYGLTEKNGMFFWTQPHIRNESSNHNRMSAEWREEVCKEVLSGIGSEGRSSIEEAMTNAYKVIAKTKGNKRANKRGMEIKIFGLDWARGQKRGRWLHRPVMMERPDGDKDNYENKDRIKKINYEEKILENDTNNSKGETSCGREDKKVGETSTDRSEREKQTKQVNEGDEHEPRNSADKSKHVEGKRDSLSLSISPETSSASLTCKQPKSTPNKNSQHLSKEDNETTNQDETVYSRTLQDDKTSTDSTATVDRTTTSTSPKAAPPSLVKEDETTTTTFSKSSPQPIDENDSTIAVFTRYREEYTPLSFVIPYKSFTKAKLSSTPSVRYISVSSRISSSLLSEYHSLLVKNIFLFEENSLDGKESKVGLCCAYCLGGAKVTQNGKQNNRKNLEYEGTTQTKIPPKRTYTVPCPIQQSFTHNGIITISPNTPHGFRLPCSDPCCVASGRTTLYCKVCDLLVDAKEFGIKHLHQNDVRAGYSACTEPVTQGFSACTKPPIQNQMAPVSNNSVNQVNKLTYQSPTLATSQHSKGVSKFYPRRLSDLHIGYSQIALHLSTCIPDFQPSSVENENDIGLKGFCKRIAHAYNLSESISGVVTKKTRVFCVENYKDRLAKV